jgi:hypothetical protein
MPVHYPDHAGKPYRPSNGTEGMIFEEMFCDHCTRFSAECEIFLSALLYAIDDDQYPKEWIFDADGRPTCTAFCDRRSDEKKATAST